MFSHLLTKNVPTKLTTCPKNQWFKTMSVESEAPMIETYKIVEKFEITGRGAVVVIDEVTEHVPGKAYKFV